MNSRIIIASAIFCSAVSFAAHTHHPSSITRHQSPDTDTVAPTPFQVGSANAVDEVVWVVGDEPILKSDIEVTRLQAMQEGIKWDRDPDCAIPEQLAVNKLFLHQAQLDSIEVKDSEVAQEIESRITWMIQQAGSREKLEEWRNMSLTQMRLEMKDELRNQILIQRMKQELVKDITVTPSAVRRYWQSMPADSLPIVPTTVEVQIISKVPPADPQEVNRIKDKLRDYTERINSGETSFATLARLYSEDGSARQGGELGYTPRAALDPTFAQVAFNLTDPNKISKIVETDFGFHIIQLIDKSGERINCRHILLKPKVNQAAIDSISLKLDTLITEVKEGKYTFESAVPYVSDDKNTRNNNGLMAYMNPETGERTSRFEMQQLPTDIARIAETMQPGDISKPFRMINEKGQVVVAVVKLKNRIEQHRASMTEDYQLLREYVLNREREKFIHQWVEQKIKTVYTKIPEQYRSCQFEFQGWIK